MRLRTLLACKTNLIGTVAIALLSSVSTVFFAHWMDGWGEREAVRSTGIPLVAAQPTSSAAITDCSSGVYSPVQKTCVDQQTFDEEMQRLFLALGLDPGIYASGEDQTPRK